MAKEADPRNRLLRLPENKEPSFQDQKGKGKNRGKRAEITRYESVSIPVLRVSRRSAAAAAAAARRRRRRRWRKLQSRRKEKRSKTHTYIHTYIHTHVRYRYIRMRIRVRIHTPPPWLNSRYLCYALSIGLWGTQAPDDSRKCRLPLEEADLLTTSDVCMFCFVRVARFEFD
jgi:hypothetical protein